MPMLETPTLAISHDAVLPDRPTGHPVLLLHSSAAGRWQWRALRPRLGPDRALLAPDLIGYGGTEDRSGQPFSIAREVAVAAALAERVDGPLHVVGHSYGGCVAIAFAAARPQAVRSLTLIEPVRFDLLRDGPDRAVLAGIESLAARHVAAVAEQRLDDAAAAFADHWSGAGTWAALPAQARASLAAAMPKVAEEWGLLLRPGPPGADPDWPGPTLLVEGGATTAAARAVMAVLARRRPDARHLRVPGAGHLSPITHASEVGALIGRFLDDNDRD